jgi:hypothetical protein
LDKLLLPFVLSSSFFIIFFWDEELGWMDDRKDGWKRG